jgi:hypothetical protein
MEGDLVGNSQLSNVPLSAYSRTTINNQFTDIEFIDFVTIYDRNHSNDVSVVKRAMKLDLPLHFTQKTDIFCSLI